MDKKKIIVSAITIGATGALLIGATFAFFTDQETSSGNTLTSGTLKIDVNDNNSSGTFNVSFGVVSNLAPGDLTGVATIKVINTGTLNAATFGRLTLSGASSPDLSDELSIYNYKVEYFDNAVCTVTTNRWSGTDPYHGTASNMDWFIKDGDATLWNGVGGSENLKTWVTGDGPLDIPGTAWDMEGLEPNECYILTVQFQMDEDASNAYQGSSVTVGYEVLSGQINAAALNALGLGVGDMTVHIPYLQSQVTP